MFSSTNVGCSGRSEWELLSVTLSSQLGSKERVSVKKIQREEREIQVEKRLRVAEKRVQQPEWQHVGMGERVQQAETRADELQKMLEEERREHERLASQLERRERMLQQAMKRVQETETRVQQERERVQMAEERAQQAEEREQHDREALGQRVRQAEAGAGELQRRLDEEKRVRESLAVQLKEGERILLQAMECPTNRCKGTAGKAKGRGEDAAGKAVG